MDPKEFEKRVAEQKAEALAEQVNPVEKKSESAESAADREHINSEIRRELDLMDLDETAKGESDEKAQKIRALADDTKLQNLLDLARQKGVVFAIKTAQSMNDPYLLDTLHDMLSKEGFYKEFLKKK